MPVGGPKPYFIIILNMSFIPKASSRASSQITASSYILERHLRVINSKPSLAFAGQEDFLSNIDQCWASVADVGPTLKQHLTVPGMHILQLNDSLTTRYFFLFIFNLKVNENSSMFISYPI